MGKTIDLLDPSTHHVAFEQKTTIKITIEVEDDDRFAAAVITIAHEGRDEDFLNEQIAELATDITRLVENG